MLREQLWRLMIVLIKQDQLFSCGANSFIFNTEKGGENFVEIGM